MMIATAVVCALCSRHVPLYHVEDEQGSFGTAIYDSLLCRRCIGKAIVAVKT